MKSIMVNKIFLVLIFLICFNCKKQNEDINILELTELKNYNVVKTKVNDSIIKVSGENDSYFIEGNVDLPTHSKEGWWTIRSKNDKNWVEIEYVFLEKQFENQIRIYNRGIFDSKSSKFYNASFKDKNYSYTFHFPKSNYTTSNIDFEYLISDTIQKKKVREGILKLEKKNDYYSCKIPTNENESVIGIVTKLSNLKQKDTVLLAVDRMFVKPLKKNNGRAIVDLNAPQ